MRLWLKLLKEINCGIRAIKEVSKLPDSLERVRRDMRAFLDSNKRLKEVYYDKEKRIRH